MRLLSTCRLVLMCCGLLLATPAVHAAPPNGDNRTAPINIALNSRKTVKHIENATLEAPAIEDTACDPSDLTTHSVWFRFEVPMSMVLDLDATGAVINSAVGTHSDIMLSYYEDVGGTITHRGCTSGQYPRLEDLLVSGDKVYYVRIASIGSAPTSSSKYKLSVRVRYILNVVQDPGFLFEPLGVLWKVKNDDNPAKIVRVCPSNCYIDFGGVAKGQLFQKVVFDPSVMRFKVGDLIYGTAYVFLTPVDGADIKLSIKIKYSDGTPPTKVSVTRHFANPSTNLAENFGPILAVVAGQVASITYSVTSPQADDTFSVLSYEAEAYAGSGPRGILPLLSAPPQP